MALEIDDAVEHAISYVRKLFGAQGISNVMLEELEAADGDRINITVGFDRAADASDGVGGSLMSHGLMALAKRGRKYKVVTIDRQTGELVAIKDRLFVG
ncbi:hypothetical protein [Stutzerimonas nitrititolerans]|uniref:hypothetical protein n=1 Tax=Stutzerimonas nitrititolerans TaxID=2482751 RepID=UPI0028A6C868|nr:hypothetical protein [Stutzerimonas nitrititolerans]